MAAMQLRQPIVIVEAPKPKPQPVKTAKVETLEQAEMRRLRVDAITRQPPEVVITRTWIATRTHFDAQVAIPIVLPLWQRFRNWLRTE